MTEPSNSSGEFLAATAAAEPAHHNWTAWYAFDLNITRVLELLKIGVSGIDTTKVEVEKLVRKLKDGLVNPEGDNEAPLPGSIRVKLNLEQVNLLIEATSVYRTFVADLLFPLHNILCVAAWSAFEGYVQTALAELFQVRPELLASKKAVSIAEVIAARDNLVELLVAKEIDDVGRKSFSDLQSYLREKVALQFSNEHADQMREVYALRNIIAHSAGYVRKEQRPVIPKSVDVHEQQLRIGTDYLKKAIYCLREAVSQFDGQLRARYGQPSVLQIPIR